MTFHRLPRLVDPYRRVAERFMLINHCAVIGVACMA